MGTALLRSGLRARARDTTACDVDQARRHVKAYFEKAARIFSAGLTRPKILQQIAYVGGLNISTTMSLIVLSANLTLIVALKPSNYCSITVGIIRRASRCVQFHQGQM